MRFFGELEGETLSEWFSEQNAHEIMSSIKYYHYKPEKAALLSGFSIFFIISPEKTRFLSFFAIFWLNIEITLSSDPPF